MTYTADDIKILKGLEAVRVRPAMYIGGTDVKGLNHLIYELIDNSVDEASNGYCNNIIVSLNADGSCTVSDNGRGIPVDLHESGISALRVVLTTLHAGGKFDNNSYKTSGGLHGVGSSVVNALSECFKVTVYKNNEIWYDEYSKGIPVVDLDNEGKAISLGSTDKTGTSITFLPDKSIFDSIVFDANDIKKRMHEISYLNPDLTLTFEDNRYEINESVTFHEPEGIAKYVNDISEEYNSIFDTHTFTDTRDNIEVSVAFKYVESSKEKVIGFCNNILTQDGGTHISALKTALTNIINQYAKQLGYIKENGINFSGEDIRSGFICTISIKHPDPQFEGQTKTKLNNKDVTGVVSSICSQEFQNYFDRNVTVLKKILNIAQKSFDIRKAQAKLKKNMLSSEKKKYSFDSNGKLANCGSKDNRKTELFIVEGDSAAGSSKMARDRKYQAILPIRGKILNVEKASIEKILANEEIKTLVYALGCGFLKGYGNDFDINKLKFNKVIIMADSDIDGFHISTLLLTLFYRLFPELIEAGHIYIANSPLYKVIPKKGKELYLYDDKSLEKYAASHKNFTLQRYKGLGEMSPKQLWDTTMNPDTRILTKISIHDVERCNNVTSYLMGTDVTYRKQFITERALEANLDV